VIKVDRDALDTLKLRRTLLGTQKITIPIAEVSGVGTSILLKSAIASLSFSGGDPAECNHFRYGQGDNYRYGEDRTLDQPDRRSSYQGRDIPQ